MEQRKRLCEDVERKNALDLEIQTRLLITPEYRAARAALSVRAASFAPRETLPVGACAGRVLAAPALSCPPCVPIAVCGEVIDPGIIERLRYYGIGACEVVRQ